MKIKKKIIYLFSIIIIIFLTLVIVNLQEKTVYIEKPQVEKPHIHTTITSEEQFVFEMIPHHQEAIDTSEFIYERTKNQELKTLAENIISAQKEEINMMEDWKRKFYSKSNYKTTYTNMMPDLRKFKGEELDKEFLWGMVAHHQMAIIMAQQVIALNPREEVKNFAEEIIKVQGEEITEMMEMLRQD